MKILYIINGNGNSVNVGGSLIRTIEIAKRINRRGNEVYFLTSSGGKRVLESYFSPTSIFEIKSYLFRYPLNRRENYLHRFLSYLIVALRSFFKIGKPAKVNLIYTDSDGFWDVIPAFLYKKRCPDVKWVSMNHHKVSLNIQDVSGFFTSFINIILQRFSYFFIRKYSNAIFVLNTDMGDKIKNFLIKKGCKKNFYYVKDGVDIEFIKKVPQQKKEYDACFLGGLRPSKGLYDLIPIWRKVSQTKVDAKLIIIGGMIQRYRDYLEKEIKKHNLENNIFIKGFIVEKKEVIRLLKQSKVFISPSHEEGWGMAIMEALASGLPAVLWDLPVYKRIFKEAVIKVEPFKIDLFAKKVLYILQDKNIYNKLKSKTFKEVIKYDWDILAKEEINILEQLRSKED